MINIIFYKVLIILFNGGGNMKCSVCGCIDSKVTDSRLNEDGTSIRRRRECIQCMRRFTTYETIEIAPILVIKKNGVRQAFDINKLKNGIFKSCEKRPVSAADINNIVDKISKKISNSLVTEITSKQIGEYVMSELKELDEVAYVRYASVHRQFKDISTFLSEIETLLKNKDNN